MAPPRRRASGEGSIARRADGRWMGRFYVWTTAGTRKRITVYGRTRQQATELMREAQERDRHGIPVPDQAWKLTDWLDYWLEHVVLPNRRRATYALYEMVVRTNLKPALGKYPLTRLSAARVQAFLNGELAAGQSIRRVQIMRTVLSSALTRAMREELVVRNVARLPNCLRGNASPSGHGPRLRLAPSWMPPKTTRSIQLSFSCSCTDSAAVRSSGSGGAIQIPTTVRSAYGSRSTVRVVCCSPGRLRLLPDGVTCLCCPSPLTRSRSAPPHKNPTVRFSARHGKPDTGSSSPHEQAGRSNLATSCGPFTASAQLTASARSRSTISVTRPPRCSKTLAFPPGTLRSSSVTHG
jgi:Phage integrase, N-terminal SAM-like domain